MKPDISFIFVNFRSAQLLQPSLSVLSQSVTGQGITAEYIIVNNDLSEHSLLGALATHPAHPLIIHQVTNGGFGRANNAGASAATGEVLFFVNPDTEFIDGNLHGLLAAFRFRPKAIYGMALSRATGGREPWSAGTFPSFARTVLAHTLRIFLSQPWEATRIQRTDWVSGAALTIRQDFFRAIGGFDEKFFLYFEDVDLARRAIEIGGWVAVYPFIRLRHTGGKSHKSFHEKKKAYYRGQMQYFKKWRPAYEGVMLSIAHHVRNIFQFL